MKFYLYLSLLLSAGSQASAYQPTLLDSKSKVDEIFAKMPEGFIEEGGFRSESQCYERAEIWSYDFKRNQNIDAMKVFIFYTYAFKKAVYDASGYQFTWWFHVAPYLTAKNASTGKPEEWVMDKTYVATPTDISTWANLFATLHTRCDENHEHCTLQKFKDDKPCAENVPYEKFIDEVASDHPVYGNEFCYLVRMPATVFHPSEITDIQSGKTKNFEFDQASILASLQDAPTRKMKAFFYQLLGF